MLYRDNQNLPQKVTVDYKTIFNRFCKTVDVYAQYYPEVENLKLEVGQINFNLILTNAHLNHLQKICRLLDQEKKSHPIILKIHQEFCLDLDKFGKGATINDSKDIYF